MQLIYLSPVPWSSFAQRPHKLVDWFYASTGEDVLWIDPYPTRFPQLSDFRRLVPKESQESQAKPKWLEVIVPKALPIEPLPASGVLNSLLWRSTVAQVEAFSRKQSTMLAIGKPSVLALRILDRLNGIESVYDAMDDFSAFYSGYSRIAMNWRERKLIDLVTFVLASSTAIKDRWSKVRRDVQLVHNALDAELLPSPLPKSSRVGNAVLGYVGTIGHWFDWDWVIMLANARPGDTVRLIGPVYVPVPSELPENIEFLPARSHSDALDAMKGFDVGLIPFTKNDLTVSVDPIKYYEYRALGLPVISTDFGEMAYRCKEEGVYISKGTRDIVPLVKKALHYCADDSVTRRFIAGNTWDVRWKQARLLNC